MDKEFFRKAMKLIKIAIPSLYSQETFYLVSLSGLLVLRTIMSIWLAEVQGQIVKAIVGRNVSEFFKRVIVAYLLMVYDRYSV